MRTPFKGDKPNRKLSKSGKILELRTFRWGKFSDRVWGRYWVCIFCGARYDDTEMDLVENHDCDLGDCNGHESSETKT